MLNQFVHIGTSIGYLSAVLKFDGNMSNDLIHFVTLVYQLASK